MRQNWLKKPFSIRPGAFLGRHLDVARREQEDLVGHPLHAAVEGVGEPAAEIDQALRELGVGALQVDDHRDVDLELVGDLLGVVEVLGDRRGAPRRAAGAAPRAAARRRARAGRAGSSAKMSS